MTIQWYATSLALVSLGTSPYTVLVSGPAVRNIKPRVTCYDADVVHICMMTVPINGTTFTSDHIVSLAERPAVPHAVIDVNDSTATCDHDCCAADDDDINVADNTSRRRIKSVHE